MTEFKTRDFKKYMIATTAIHMMGDISREIDPKYPTENLCFVYNEDEENYYGMWVLGFGMFDVRFPKETTRELTESEIKYCNSKRVAINNQPSQALKVD